MVNQGIDGQLLSDGVHVITAKLCDDKDNVFNNSNVELSNLDPVVFVDFTPSLNY